MAMLSEPSYSENNQEALKYAQRLYSSFYNIYSAIPMSSDSQFYGKNRILKFFIKIYNMIWCLRCKSSWFRLWIIKS